MSSTSLASSRQSSCVRKDGAQHPSVALARILEGLQVASGHPSASVLMPLLPLDQSRAALVPPTVLWLVSVPASSPPATLDVGCQAALQEASNLSRPLALAGGFLAKQGVKLLF